MGCPTNKYKSKPFLSQVEFKKMCIVLSCLTLILNTQYFDLRKNLYNYILKNTTTLNASLHLLYIGFHERALKRSDVTLRRFWSNLMFNPKNYSFYIFKCRQILLELGCQSKRNYSLSIVQLHIHDKVGVSINNQIKTSTI